MDGIGGKGIDFFRKLRRQKGFFCGSVGKGPFFTKFALGVFDIGAPFPTLPPILLSIDMYQFPPFPNKSRQKWASPNLNQKLFPTFTISTLTEKSYFHVFSNKTFGEFKTISNIVPISDARSFVTEKEEEQERKDRKLEVTSHHQSISA